MITNPKQDLTCADEIAMISIVEQVKMHIITHGKKIMTNDNIGFAVSISFKPTESVGQRAAMTLLKINRYCEFKDRVH